MLAHNIHHHHDHINHNNESRNLNLNQTNSSPVKEQDIHHGLHTEFSPVSDKIHKDVYDRKKYIYQTDTS